MKRTVCVLLVLTALMLIAAACSAPPAPPSVPATSAPAASTSAPATSAPPPAAATTAAKPAATVPAFPTKDVTFIIPVSPGGGFDTNARILAPYLKKYLPNQPNVVPKNVPGGEWRLGIMEMYKAAPDGHTISIFNMPGNVMGQVTNNAEYDLNKVAWIGRITDTIYVTALSPKSKYRTLDDLRKGPAPKVGVVGLTSGSAVAEILTAAAMNYEIKLINYDGSTDSILSAIRGDVDMVIYPFPTLQKFVVNSTDLIPFVVYSKERLKELPDTPTIGEMGNPDLLSVVALDYMVGATPGTPEPIMKIWRDAFDKAVKDPEFLKLMNEQLKRAPVSLNAEQTTALVKDQLTLYAKYKDLIEKYMPK